MKIKTIIIIIIISLGKYLLELIKRHRQKLQYPSFMSNYFFWMKGRVASENDLLHRTARKKAINNKYSSI